MYRPVGGQLPDVKEVIISPGCQLLSIRAPFQTANLLVVSVKCSENGLPLPAQSRCAKLAKLALWLTVQKARWKGTYGSTAGGVPDIMVLDVAIPSSRAQRSVVPGKCRYPCAMATQGTNLLHPVHIPDLHLRTGCANAEVLTISCPGYAGDVVICLTQLCKKLDRPIRRIPEVSSVAQRNSNLADSSQSIRIVYKIRKSAYHTILSGLCCSCFCGAQAGRLPYFETTSPTD